MILQQQQQNNLDIEKNEISILNTSKLSPGCSSKAKASISTPKTQPFALPLVPPFAHPITLLFHQLLLASTNCVKKCLNKWLGQACHLCTQSCPNLQENLSKILKRRRCLAGISLNSLLNVHSSTKWSILPWVFKVTPWEFLNDDYDKNMIKNQNIIINTYHNMLCIYKTKLLCDQVYLF